MTTSRLSDIISPHFAACHRSIAAGDTQELILKGGRGSGKSSFAAIELVLTLLRQETVHAAVLRKVGNTIRTSVYAQVTWAIRMLGLEGSFRMTRNPAEMTYLPTGQKILFFGLDDPDKLKSVKTPFGYIGVLWFEELDQFAGEEELRSIEQSTLRGGERFLILRSFNPPASGRHWVNRFAGEKRAGRLTHHSSYLDMPPHFLGTRFLADAEHLKETNETAYRHEYLGECVGTGTEVFGNVTLRAVDDAEIDSFGTHYFGQDWGWYPDPNAFNACAYHAGSQRLLIYDERHATKCANDSWAAALAPYQTQRITADPGGGGTRQIADFRDMGFLMQAARKGRGSVAYSMRWLCSRREIIIDPNRCPRTAAEFTAYQHEQDAKTGEILEGYVDKDNHHIDATRYALEPVWRRRGS